MTCFISTLPSVPGAVAGAARGGLGAHPEPEPKGGGAETGLAVRRVNGAQPPAGVVRGTRRMTPTPNRDPSLRRFCCQVDSATDTQVSP